MMRSSWALDDFCFKPVFEFLLMKKSDSESWVFKIWTAHVNKMMIMIVMIMNDACVSTPCNHGCDWILSNFAGRTRMILVPVPTNTGRNHVISKRDVPALLRSLFEMRFL